MALGQVSGIPPEEATGSRFRSSCSVATGTAPSTQEVPRERCWVEQVTEGDLDTGPTRDEGNSAGSPRLPLARGEA